MQNEWIKQLLFNKTHSQTVMVKGSSRGPSPDQPGILQSTEYKGHSYSLMFPFTYINDSYILCYQLKIKLFYYNYYPDNNLLYSIVHNNSDYTFHSSRTQILFSPCQLHQCKLA